MSIELLQQPHSEVEKIDRLNDRWELVRGCLQSQKDPRTRKGNQFFSPSSFPSWLTNSFSTRQRQGQGQEEGRGTLHSQTLIRDHNISSFWSLGEINSVV